MSRAACSFEHLGVHCLSKFARSGWLDLRPTHCASVAVCLFRRRRTLWLVWTGLSPRFPSTTGRAGSPGMVVCCSKGIVWNLQLKNRSPNNKIYYDIITNDISLFIYHISLFIYHISQVMKKTIIHISYIIYHISQVIKKRVILVSQPSSAVETGGFILINV